MCFIAAAFPPIGVSASAGADELDASNQADKAEENRASGGNGNGKIKNADRRNGEAHGKTQQFEACDAEIVTTEPNPTRPWTPNAVILVSEEVADNVCVDRRDHGQQSTVVPGV